MADIDFFDDVFDPDFCRFLLTNARAELDRGSGFRRSNFHWDDAIRRSSAVVLVRDYDSILTGLVLDRLIERGMIGHRGYHVMNYAWTRLSYIPWHDDGQRDEALTVYLNEQWEWDWGGLFLHAEPDGSIRATPPRFNCGLKNRANVRHSTTPVSLDAPEPRFTLQCFATESAAAALSEPPRSTT